MTLKFKGKLEKLTWAQVRDDVFKVNPKLAKIIDDLNPDSNHWLARVTYPYGCEVMKESLLMLPNDQGDIVPITDASLNSVIKHGLGYNLNSNPVSLVLKNSFEIFLPLDDRTIPLSGLIYAGTAFGASRILALSKKSQQPAFIWDMTSGGRSVSMLPKITEVKKHKRLMKEYQLPMQTPKTLLNHWDIFRHIANHESAENSWSAQILFFSASWFDHLEDAKWKNFYDYFRNSIWCDAGLTINHVIWNLVFSLILKDYEIRPSAYILDTVKYLLYMSVGAFTGLAPARDNTGGPFETIQRIYLEDYELKNYAPVIIQPVVFNTDELSASPGYYSLQNPIAFEFKQNSRVKTSIISDLHEIRNLIIRYEKEVSTKKFNLEQTVLGTVFDNVQFDYFHNNVELHQGMRNSIDIFQEDPSFSTTIDGRKFNEYPDNSSFVRGCVRLAKKS